MDKQSIYEDYIQNFNAPELVKPVTFDESQARLNAVPYKMLTFSKSKPMATAYATRSSNFGQSGIYNIYINPEYNKSYLGLLLHETGHIIFGHLQSNSFNDTTFKMKVKFAWPRIRKLIEIEDGITMSESDIQSIYIDKVSKILLNYAMDYEVNSKLFTVDEFSNFQKSFENDYMKELLSDENVSPEFYQKIVDDKKADPSKEISKALWPEDVGFPCKLQFTQYIDLMIKNPEEFFQKLKLNKNNSAGDGSNDPSSSQKSNNSSNGKITLNDLDDLAESFDDMDEGKMNDLLQKAEEAERTISDDEDGDGDDTIGEIEIDTDEWGGYSASGPKATRSEIINLSHPKELENKILKEVFNKVVNNTRQDPVYNYNRKKYNSNVFISKSRPEQLWRPGNIILLVDCSGSIANNAISAMIDCVKKVAKKCGPKSRIIWWDTSLEGDYSLRLIQPPKYCGSTNIGRGISYVKEHYLKQSNDKLIIISDYEDRLQNWYEAASHIKNDIIGLCWLYSNGKEKIEDYLSFWGDSDISIKDFLKKIPTTLVNISNNDC